MVNLLPRSDDKNKKRLILIVAINLAILIGSGILWYTIDKKHKDFQTESKIAMQNAIRIKKDMDNKRATMQTATPKKILGLTQGVNGALNIHFEQIDVRKLLQELADIKKINLIIHPDIRGFVNLSFNHVSWQDAFNSILKLQNLVQFNENNVLFILTESEAKQWEKRSLGAEKRESKIFYIKHRKAAEIIALLKENNQVLTDQTRVIIDNNHNSLIINEVVSHLEDIANLIEQLDHSPKQVLISARIVSVDENYVKDLGAQLGVAMVKTENETTLTQTGSQSGIGVGELFVAIADLDDMHVLDLALFALERNGHGKVISRPRLITLDRQPAYIQSGEEIPYEEKTASGATNITFKKAVMSLHITPEMTASDKINLKLTVNQDKMSSFLVRGVPGIDTQQLATQAIVKDGQTIVLGGIYEEVDQEQTESIPLVNRIPWLGELFTHRTRNKSRKELLVFITPKMIEI